MTIPNVNTEVHLLSRLHALRLPVWEVVDLTTGEVHDTVRDTAGGRHILTCTIHLDVTYADSGRLFPKDVVTIDRPLPAGVYDFRRVPVRHITVMLTRKLVNDFVAS